MSAYSLNALWRRALVAASALLAVTAAAPAQNTPPLSAQVTIASGFSNASAVAADASGDIYVLDTGADGAIYKETPSPAGYTQSAVAPGVSGAVGLAVDSSDDVLVATPTSVVKETPSSAGYTQSTLLTGLSAVNGIAVDGTGAVFLSEWKSQSNPGCNCVVKETPLSTGYTSSTFAGGGEPLSVAVDAAGDAYVYLGQVYANYILEFQTNEQPTGGPIYGSGSVAVDAAGDLYYLSQSLPSNPNLMERTPSNQQLTLANNLSNVALAASAPGMVYAAAGSQVLALPATTAGFGASAVGTAAPAQTLTLSFLSSVTLSSCQAVTQGASGQDFAVSACPAQAATPNGPCVAGASYAQDDTCTLTATFTPSYAGLRTGAVQLYSSSSGTTPIATLLLSGIGAGPQLSYAPPSQSTIKAINSVNDPYGMAIDGSGRIFIADSNNQRILVETPSGGGYTESSITDNFNYPYGLAVDGAGNLYVADTYNNRVVKLPVLSDGTFGAPAPIGSSLSFPNGVAVDASGNVYIAQTPSSPTLGTVYKETLAPNGAYTQTTIGSGWNMPKGIAVDSAGNLYVTDPGVNKVYKETLSAGAYTQSLIATVPQGVNSPFGIAVGNNGIVYIADPVSQQLLEETPAASGYTQTVVATNGVTPWAVAVDAKNDLYIGDAGNQQVVKVDQGDTPSFTFASTAVGANSADSPQTLTLINVGNAPLSFSVPASGDNPAVSANFSLGAASTCPQLTPSSSATSLAANAGCTELLSFTPTTAGSSLQGSLVLADNALNNASAMQTFSLAGTSTPGQVMPQAAASSIVYGTASSTLNAAFSYGGAAPTGAVSFTLSSPAVTLTQTAVCSAAAGVRTCSASFATGALTVGRYAVAIVESADADYASAAASTSLTITQATPVVTWPTPPSLTAGTALGAAQLDATANTPGTFAYSPPAGTVFPAAGSQTLTVLFTPTNTVDFTPATASVTLSVVTALPPVCKLGLIQASNAAYTVNATVSCTDPQNLPVTTTISWNGAAAVAVANNASATNTFTSSQVNQPLTALLTGTDTAGLVGTATQTFTLSPPASGAQPGGSSQVSTTVQAPSASSPTQVRFICPSVSTGTVKNALPSEFGITCSSSPEPLSPNLPVNVTIQTSAAITIAANPSNIYAVWVLPLPGLGSLILGGLLPGCWGRRRRRFGVLGLSVLLCLALSSCGGSFVPPVTSTAVGTYYITVADVAVTSPAPSGFVQTSLIVPFTVCLSAPCSAPSTASQ